MRPFHRGKRARPCANCGAHCQRVFCEPCYRLVDGGTKQSFRNLCAIGEPKLAIRRVLDTLDALREGGVPVPERGAERTVQA
jgi:hypothetical protein